METKLPFATLADVIKLWRAVTPEEVEKVTALLPIISDTIRYEAEKYGKDIDLMILESPSYANVVKMTVIDILARTLNTQSSSIDTSNMTQFSQSALGYTVSGTYANAGGGLFIKKSEWARLGFRRQKIGVIEPYGDINQGNFY